MYGPVPEGEPTPPEFYVVHEDAKGKLDGAMAYEILDRDSWWGKPGYIELHDLFGSPTAYVSLWRHALDLDLAEGVKFHMRMPDEALRWMLADPRRLEMKLEDQLWLRVLDVPGALAARTYGGAGPARGRRRRPVPRPWGQIRDRFCGIGSGHLQAEPPVSRPRDDDRRPRRRVPRRRLASRRWPQRGG